MRRLLISGLLIAVLLMAAAPASAALLGARVTTNEGPVETDGTESVSVYIEYSEVKLAYKWADSGNGYKWVEDEGFVDHSVITITNNVDPVLQPLSVQIDCTNASNTAKNFSIPTTMSTSSEDRGTTTSVKFDPIGGEATAYLFCTVDTASMRTFDEQVILTSQITVTIDAATSVPDPVDEGEETVE